MKKERMTKERWISPQEAHTLLGIADRTLRKWAAKGRLTRETGPDGKSRYRLSEVQALRAELGLGTGSPPAAAEEGGAERERLEAAIEAARIAAQGLGEARARERQLLSEIIWLRGALERAQQTQHELCQLLLSHTRTVEHHRAGGDAALSTVHPRPAGPLPPEGIPPSRGPRLHAEPR
jgi:hypothetical protein